MSSWRSILSCALLLSGVVFALPARSKAQVRLRADTLLEFRTKRIPNARVDVDRKILRARYRMSPRAATASPEAVLRSESKAFGWSDDLDGLTLMTDRRLSRSRHVTFQQVVKGIPVEGRYVRVNMDAEGRPTMLLSGYAPLSAVDRLNINPTLSGEQASRIAEALFPDHGGGISPPSLAVYPRTTPRLAWRILAWPANEPAEYVVLVDAHDGSILSATNQAISHREADISASSYTSGAQLDTDWHIFSDQSDVSMRPSTLVTGTGYVFIPDPLTSAGVPYGPPFVDGNDASNPQLDGERRLVSLLDISTDGQGRFVLTGPHVQIIGTNQADQVTYTPPALSGPNDFLFTREQLDFEAVNAYYHIDTAQRYIQSFGIPDRQNRPIGVNPHGLTSDDSFYFPNKNILLFGSGGVDDAEDASVLWHEYGHALLQDAAPGLLSSAEGHALHEGWSDYWAASYARDLWESGKSGRADWDRMFRWDSGDGSIWGGRVLDDTGHYPEDVCSAGSTPIGCSAHDDGRLWGTVMMEIYSDLGKAITDELSLRSHEYLTAPATFADAAEAVIQTDLDYFGGAHINVLLSRFGARGLVDAGGFSPSVDHQPVTWSENLGGTALISAEAVGLSSPVESVILHYEDISGSELSVPMQPVSETRYEGQLSIPSTPGSIWYYLEVADTGGRTTRLPSGAPGERFELQFGPDTEAPTLLHEPVEDIPFSSWPPELSVYATDNLGMDHVTAGYRIEDVFGELLVEGEFNLTQDGEYYRDAFPVSPGLLPSFVHVAYWLEGVDASQASNSTRLPLTGAYEFMARSDGVIRTLSFESPSSTVSYSGSWEQGAPDFALRVAHSGSSVLGTTLSGPYPSSGNLSSITLSRVNLSGVSEAYLTFWHWYDIEHDGSANPGSSDAQLWDGANLKIATNGDRWQLAVPEGGYNGVVATSQFNPLSGEPAFGGYSYGWRQVIVPLPPEEDVRIRFDFGTDDTNTDEARWFAGWYIDDLKITTVRPADDGLPSAVTLPPVSRILSTEDAQPTVDAQLLDDNGVADVFVDYTYSTRSGDESGIIRMELDPTTVRTYVASLDFADMPMPSDRIAYVLRVSDYSGNVTVFPESGGTFDIEYRLEDVLVAAEDAVSSGIWAQNEGGWTLGSTSGLADVSSINLSPFDLPANSTRAELVVTHLYDLTDDFGGNVKLSADGGTTWILLTPLDGYPAQLSLVAGHPMDEEWGFSDDSFGTVTDRFSLADWAGEQIRIRIDMATERSPRSGEFWNITAINLETATADDAFEVPRTLSLHPAYPNPVSTTTRIGYTLEESGTAEVGLYDVLGRRIRLIANGYHDAGTYEKTLSASELTAGVYVLRLISHGRQRVQTLVVVR